MTMTRQSIGLEKMLDTPPQDKLYRHLHMRNACEHSGIMMIMAGSKMSVSAQVTVWHHIALGVAQAATEKRYVYGSLHNHLNVFRTKYRQVRNTMIHDLLWTINFCH